MPFPSSRALRGAVLATALALTGSLLVAPAATAAPSAPIIQAAPGDTYAKPIVYGSVEQYGYLEAAIDYGNFSWQALGYQWFRNGAPIAGAVRDWYSPTAEDASAAGGLFVRVTYTESNGQQFTTISDTLYGPSFDYAPTPTISGTVVVGARVTASTGAWSPTASFSYQWLRDGSPISGARASSYVAVAEDLGRKLSVTVTGSASGIRSATKTSAATTVVAVSVFAAAPTPKISATLTQSKVLTAVPGTWSPSATLRYQWLRNGAKISGATARTYTLTGTDSGKTITVAVTGARAGYTTLTKTSTGLKIANLFSAAPTPWVTGAPATFGTTLTAKTGTWAPGGATLKYQWKRNGVNISGATKSTYRVTAADMVKTITVTVTGTKAGYQTSVRTSTGVPGLHKFTSTAAPKISGSTKTGALLTATGGGWSTTGLTLKYQWKRNGVNIAGATAKTFRLSGSDGGKKISVTVTASRANHVSVSRTSASTAAITTSVMMSGDNTWLVGSEIMAGTYVTTGTPTDFCYSERLRNLSGALSGIIANDLGNGQRIMTVSASDRAFSANDCGSWTLLQNKPMTKKSTIPDSGIFSVSRQIVPGTYRASNNVDGCYWARLSDFTSTGNNIIANDFTYDSRPVVSISASDVGFEANGCGTWTRIGN